VHREVDDRHGRIVLEREQQTQCPDDGAVDHRSAVRAVPRPARGDELAPEGDVLARRSGRIAGTVGALARRPDLAPGGEAVVVRAEFQEGLRGWGHALFYRPAQRLSGRSCRRALTAGHDTLTSSYSTHR
jgi:hypothetical protein